MYQRSTLNRLKTAHIDCMEFFFIDFSSSKKRLFVMNRSEYLILLEKLGLVPDNLGGYDRGPISIYDESGEPVGRLHYSRHAGAWCLQATGNWRHPLSPMSNDERTADEKTIKKYFNKRLQC